MKLNGLFKKSEKEKTELILKRRKKMDLKKIQYYSR
jgi:hypothetical protein